MLTVGTVAQFAPSACVQVAHSSRRLRSFRLVLIHAACMYGLLQGQQHRSSPCRSFSDSEGLIEEEAADELLLPTSPPTPWFRDLNILLVLAVTAFYLAVFKLLDELAPLFVSAPRSNVSAVVSYCTCLRDKCNGMPLGPYCTRCCAPAAAGQLIVCCILARY